MRNTEVAAAVVDLMAAVVPVADFPAVVAVQAADFPAVVAVQAADFPAVDFQLAAQADLPGEVISTVVLAEVPAQADLPAVAGPW